MTLTLILPWFPILLGVGVGGRLLGRTRGLYLGILSAFFWVVLVQASAGPAIWREPWTVVMIVAGAVAIAAMGRWSGETPVDRLSPTASAQPPANVNMINRSDECLSPLQQLTTALDQFDDWLEEHRDDNNPWPKFDELVRSVMYQCCQATHVKPYRLRNEGEELVPLNESDPLVDVEPLPARRGIVGHVVTTGRSYVASDMTKGELVEQLAEESQDTVAWCFAVRQGTSQLGAVVVGQLGIAPDPNRPLLCAMERLISQFWCMLCETIRSRRAVQDDPVSGVLIRPAFLHRADEALRESYREGEPVAVAVIALEGLRRLRDSGRWEVADQVVRETSNVVRRKVRMDDRLGRFDDFRFLLLLRRVDSGLASLIVAQLMSRLTGVCHDRERWRETVDVRCGVAGSGTERPDLRTLVSRALAQYRRARLENAPIASDLGSTSVANGVTV